MNVTIEEIMATIKANNVEKLISLLAQVSSLDLSRQNINTRQIIQIAEVLKKNETLIHIDLSENAIESRGIKQLAKALKINKTISSIVLSRNEIGDRSVCEITEALKINKTISYIDLSMNKIGDRGAGKIAKVLEKNKILTSLNISWNEIGDKGIVQIAEALKINKTLMSLNVMRSEIKIKGASQIAEVLKINKTLMFLNISGSNIEERCTTLIVGALKENKSLISTDLAWCLDSEKIKQHVRGVLRSNLMALVMPIDNLLKELKSSSAELKFKSTKIIEIETYKQVIEDYKKTLLIKSDYEKLARLKDFIYTLSGNYYSKVEKEVINILKSFPFEGSQLNLDLVRFVLPNIRHNLGDMPFEVAYAIYALHRKTVIKQLEVPDDKMGERLNIQPRQEHKGISNFL